MGVQFDQKGVKVNDRLLTRQLIGHLLPPARSGARAIDLTAKDRLILEGVVAGQLNKEIATTPNVSEKTVRKQLGVKTTAEAAIAFERLRSPQGV